MIPFVDLAKQQERIKPDLDRRIASVLAHNKYILGPEVQELEEKLAAYVGVKHCITCASGTDALLIALMALGIGRGDEVITSAFTYVATGEVIARVGARPVFVDIDPKTYNIDPDLIEPSITGNTKAIMPVSLYGQCADFDRINDIGRRYNLPVIEDGAQSFGATYRGRRSCGLSTIGCTSFFPTKPLGCYGDGGACFTNDDELAKAMTIIHKHGQDRRYHHVRMGLNSRLDTLQAAVLLAKLEQFDAEIRSRAAIGRLYNRLLNGVLGVETPQVAEGNTSVYAQYTIRVEDREALQSALKAKDIPTAVHYPIPLNRQPMFDYLDATFDVPNAEEAAKHVVSLPMSAWMNDATVEAVANAVREHVGGSDASRGMIHSGTSTPRSVLMVAYFFPPLGGSGVFRSLKFSKYLHEFNWQPTVIAADKPPLHWNFADESLLADVPKDIEIMRVPDKYNDEIKTGYSSARGSEMLNFLFNVLQSDAAAQKTFLELMKTQDGVMTLLRSFDSTLSWACDAFKYIESNVDVNRFDVLYTTSGPRSANVLGYYMKQKYNIPWVADYRDQWVDNPFPQYGTNTAAISVFRHLENILLHKADCSITTAEGIVPEYMDHFNLPSSKIVAITNGYDEADFSRYPMEVEKNPKFTLNYSGIIYAGRNTDVIFAALQQLCSEGLIDKNEIRFRLTGFSTIDNADVAKRYGLESIIVQMGYVPHREAIESNIHSDIVILLNNESPRHKNIYSGKIFECLRSGRPILAIAPKGGVVEQTLRETGHGKSFVSTQLDEIKQMILEEYTRWKNSTSSKRMYSPKIKQFERKFLTSKLAKIFDRVIPPPPITLRSADQDEPLDRREPSEFSSQIYDDLYEAGGYQQGYHRHYTQVHYYPAWQRALRLIEQAVRDHSASILEIGCGVGQFANMLFDNGFENYVGFDFSPKAIERAKKTNARLADRFHVADAFTTDIIERRYDLIVCFEVLEHLNKDLELLSRIQSGTKVILSVPNFPDPHHVRYFKDAREVYDRYSPVVKISAIEAFRMSNIHVLYYIVGEKV